MSARFTADATAVSLAHANQLPLPNLQSASGHESDSCKQCYSKYLDFYLSSSTLVAHVLSNFMDNKECT